MAQNERTGAIGELIAWLAVCGFALAGAFLGLLSSTRHKSFFDIENSYRSLVMAQVFFIYFLWPLFESKKQLYGSLIRLLGLVVAAVPLVVIALMTQEVSRLSVVLSQLFILVLGVSVAAALRLPRARAWYYPAALLVAAGVPFIAYLLYEQSGASTTWAAVISPFWAALSTIGGANLPLVFHACLAAALVAGALICSKSSASR